MTLESLEQRRLLAVDLRCDLQDVFWSPYSYYPRDAVLANVFVQNSGSSTVRTRFLVTLALAKGHISSLKNFDPSSARVLTVVSAKHMDSTIRTFDGKPIYGERTLLAGFVFPADG